ncbi:MAG TPA: C4-type zinc ribbon domain-containing protein [Phycisphaerae bacterium]|nr:C4-type zinc ribbon domain-containing protein [Phycisphaerae bacterium]HPS52219.1 C4-type zinc ribbon domain-containing protein [Phycisphaerae bacterium]
MGPIIQALVKLQAIELDLTRIKRRRKAKGNAVTAQENRIAQLNDELSSLKEQSLGKRKKADEFELFLNTNRQRVEKLRTDLNAARTNKEYAAILTQINTQKADDARVEEEALALMNEIDSLQAQITDIETRTAQETEKLATIKGSCAEEIEKLDRMITELTEKRNAAAVEVPKEELAIFNRLSNRFEGEAMAEVLVEGKKPPYTYTCSGCYMSLKAEHANALLSHDKVRLCDNCGRIIYLTALK